MGVSSMSASRVGSSAIFNLIVGMICRFEVNFQFSYF